MNATSPSIQQFVLENVPVKIVSTVNSKIMMKTDYQKKDGSYGLYLELQAKSERVRISLDISIPKEHWNKSSQTVNKKNGNHVDYNLIIEQVKAKVNKIKINYRLSGLPYGVNDVVDALKNPNARVCFNAFAKAELESNKGLLSNGTYNAHRSVLKKIKEFQDPLFFNSIDMDLIKKYKVWLGKAPRKNNINTIMGNLKTFKKYIGDAESKGIFMLIKHKDIKVKAGSSRITFHTADELKRLNDYYESSFINKFRKVALQRYLFSCFTGLRAGDLWKISIENVIGDTLAFTADKSPHPFVRVKLNESARKYIGENKLWIGTMTQQKVNVALKEIAKECGIPKNLHLHVARHTFATQYLANGGRLAKLKHIMGHSNITQTSVYVHVVDNLLDGDIYNMDSILKRDLEN